MTSSRQKNRFRREDRINTPRQRRAVEAVIAGTAAVVGAVAIVATAGYAISVDVKSKKRDELLEKKIDEDRQRLASLTTVVKLHDESINEVAKMIRKSETPIITFSGIELGEDEKMREKMVDTDPNTLNNFFASYSQRIFRETIRAIMLLSTQRMPMMSKFITAIRAQCLAIKDTEDIKAERYSVANLGYFKTDGSRWKLNMPLQLIVMHSREVLKMNPSLCLKFNPSFACSIT
ncbi:unnamed protein product [Oikopleura dioica]|uniref:Uncharacterized protein n=1 Tax=Oikopleura dioica TaxID=34765 RepID=E4XCK3_OIKDI|nr:unnamed protein product [Oikopleura dioica]